MSYQWLLIDADDTLFDYDAAETDALAAAFADFDIDVQPAHAEAYRQINAALWKAFERGEIAQDILRLERFRQLFQAFGMEVDVEAFSTCYLRHLGQAGHLLPGAIALLEALLGKVGLVLITNGIAGVQRSRLVRSGLERYFDAVIISDEVGAAKPDPAIFDAAFAAMGYPPKTTVLMVGDSLTSDIAGGVAYGLDTCWFNPQAKPCPAGLQICYEVRRLDEVLDLVKVPAEG